VFAAENWLATVYTSLDVVVLSVVAGEAAVGLYTAAWKIIRLGSLAAYSYTTAVFPVLSRLYAASRPQFHKLSRDTVRYMIMLALPAIAAVTVLQNRVIDLLYTAEYREAGPVLSVLVWVMLLLFINPFLSYTLFARGRQRASMNVAAVSLVVNLLATLWLASRWGAVGAAYGTLIGGLVALCGYSLYALRGWELRELGEVTLRVAVAATGLGAALYFTRHFPLPALIGLGAIAYGLLLLLVGVIRMTDLLALRTRFQAKANG
jgi:O-antigen/teichoic acid export membrane protein